MFNISSTTVSTSVLEGQTLAMGMWSLGLGAVGAAIAGIILANTDYLLTKPAPASLEYLENADLRPIEDGKTKSTNFGEFHKQHKFKCLF